MEKRELKNTDKIIMKDMAFFAYHGVMKEERALGQKFIVSIELSLSLKEAGKTDDISKTVSYAEVYDLVKELVENVKFMLLEALSENIASIILKDFQMVSEVSVEIKKPEAPIPGIFDYMAVKINRSRD